MHTLNMKEETLGQKRFHFSKTNMLVHPPYVAPPLELHEAAIGGMARALLRAFYRKRGQIMSSITADVAPRPVRLLCSATR